MAHLISGIHNYCDRWCECCNFITQCGVGLMQIQSADEKEMTSEKFVEMMQNIYVDIDEQLSEFFEDFEPDELNDEEIHEMEVDDLITDTHPLSLLSEQYFMLVKEISNNFKERVEKEWDIIDWYHIFIFIKFKRAVHGLREDNFWETDEENPFQTDSNGTAKVAMIGVERSIIAWRRLFEKIPYQPIQKALGLLRMIHEAGIQTFPDYQKFIRPGFDT